MKLATYIHATLDALPGFATLKFPYNATMLAVLKKYPGCRWDDPRHCWLVPNELVSGFLDFAKVKFGWQTVCDMKVSTIDMKERINKAAHKYQKEDIEKALLLKRAMLAWDPGLGKTLGGCEWLRLSDADRALVVVPAMARGVWVDELKMWWPDHPRVSVIRTRKEAAAFALQASERFLCVISYELLKDLMLPAKVTHAVLDESHYIKDPKAGRSKAAEAILDKWNIEWRLFLTGTPITVNPIDVFNQVHCLYPRRFGRNRYEFGDTYCGRVENSYRHRGYDYDGVNAARSDELFKRLSSVVLRRTKDEVKDQLPPLRTQTIRLQADKSILRKLDEALKRGGNVDDVLAQAGNEKIDPIISLVEEDFAGGATHINLSTYFQNTANEVAGRLNDSIGKWQGNRPIVFHVDGNVPEKKRSEILATAAAQPYSIVVSTMKAINVGLNVLKNFSPAYCCELYSAPGIMNQWLSRFYRLGSEKPFIKFVVLEGSDEEMIANTITKRIRENAKVITKGKADEAILGALEEDEETPAQFIQRLRKAMANSAAEDVYGGAA